MHVNADYFTIQVFPKMSIIFKIVYGHEGVVVR